MCVGTEVKMGRGMPDLDRHCCSSKFRETNSLRRTMQIVECRLLHRQAQGRVSSQPRTPASICENLLYPMCTCLNPPLQIPWHLHKPSESESEVAQSWLFVAPWNVAYQAPPSMRFSRQEYWSGLPFPSPGGLPNPGIEPVSPALKMSSLLLSHQGSRGKYNPNNSIIHLLCAHVLKQSNN